MRIKSISPSRIKTYQMCLMKYYMTYHMPNVQLKSNFGAANGSLLHDILENYSTKKDTDWMIRLYKGYQGKLTTVDKFGKVVTLDSPLKWAKDSDFREKKAFCDTCRFKENNHCKISGDALDQLGGCPKLLFEGSLEMLEQVIKRYQALYDRPDLIIGTEYSCTIPIPNTTIPWFGIMDLVIQRDAETIEIIDYKSGSYAQTYDECRVDLQPKHYAWAARKEFIEDVNNKGFKYKYVILTFDYFTAQPVTLAFTEEDDKNTEKEMLDHIKKIEKTTTISRIIGDKGEFNWKCKGLCDPKMCQKHWPGSKFNVQE